MSKIIDFEKVIEDNFNLNRIFSSITKPYLLTFFKYCSPYLSEQDYAEYLNYVYISVEVILNNVNVSKKEIINFFINANKRYLMSEDDYEVFKAMPDTVKIYRGVRNEKYKCGISWTLSLEKARWFANRFSKDGIVYECDIPKEYILAYFDSRNEAEIVVDVTNLRNKIKRYE